MFRKELIKDGRRSFKGAVLSLKWRQNTMLGWCSGNAQESHWWGAVLIPTLLNPKSYSHTFEYFVMIHFSINLPSKPGLQRSFSPSGVLKTHCIHSTSATWPSHLTIPRLIIPTLLRILNYQAPHYAVFPILGSNILNSLFSDSQCLFFPQCERQSFMSIQNYR
jgi:hypothetical protein